MSENSNKTLVKPSGAEHIRHESRKSPIIRRMTKDVLIQATARGLSQVRYRTGECKLREPDYRPSQCQIDRRKEPHN